MPETTSQAPAVEIPPADGPDLRPSHQIAATSVEIPAFWKENANLWFIQIESIFQLSGITRDETKFTYVIANLDEQMLQYVSDIILSTTINRKFEALKERLISRFQESEETKLRRLLSGMQIGDLKPSHFLQKIINLGTNEVSSKVMKSLFLEQLPENVKAILAISQIEDVMKLAEQADKIYEVTSPQIAAVSISTNSNQDLMDRVKELELEINELKNFRSTSRKRTNSSFRSNSRSKSKEKRKFGNSAQKCILPCEFSPKN